MKKAFTQTLVELRGGELVEEATNQLNELVSMVRDTGKPGKITVTIDVKPFSKVADALEVTGKVTTSLPREKETAEVFFPTFENNLSRHSERQTELPGISLADSRSSSN
jgi:hypothetical protein